MIRLNPEDFRDPHELAKYAATAGISLEEFVDQFNYVIDIDRGYENKRDYLIRGSLVADRD
jgi:6-phosphofructokinase 1